MTSQQSKQAQRAVPNKLGKALESDKKVTIEPKYYVSLPSNDAHSGHPLGCDVCGFAQRVHLLASPKINELVSSGITDTGKVKCHIHLYVTHTVSKELGIHSKPTDRTFHHTKPHMVSKKGTGTDPN